MTHYSSYYHYLRIGGRARALNAASLNRTHTCVRHDMFVTGTTIYLTYEKTSASRPGNSLRPVLNIAFFP